MAFEFLWQEMTSDGPIQPAQEDLVIKIRLCRFPKCDIIVRFDPSSR